MGNDRPLSERLRGIADVIDKGTPSVQLDVAEALAVGIAEALARKTDSFRDSGDAAGLKLWLTQLAAVGRLVGGYTAVIKSATITIRPVEDEDAR